MKRSILLALVLALAACDTVFASFKPAKTSDLEIGRTTYDQAVGQLGKPTSEGTLPDGRRVATYIYLVQGQAVQAPTTRGGVPALRTSAGSSGVNTSAFQMTFAPDGVLQSYNWNAQ